MGKVFAEENIYKGQDALWEAVFDCYPCELMVKKREYYNNFFQLKEEAYDNISSCIETAKKTKNHLAFVRYFLEKCVCEEILFVRRLREYIARVNFEEGSKESCWFGSSSRTCRLPIIKGNLFQDKTCTDMRRKEGLRPLPKIGENTGRAEHGFVDPQNLRKWYTGENCPKDRYEIVQCAFYLYLTVEETDELLKLSGLPKLYPVNLIDHICIKHLRKYEKKGKNDRKLSQKRIYEIYDKHIKALKEEINLSLTRYDELGEVYRRNILVKKGTKKVNGVKVWACKDGINKVAEEDRGKKPEKVEFENSIKQMNDLIDKMAESRGESYKKLMEIWLQNNDTGKLTKMYRDHAETDGRLATDYLKNSVIGFHELQRQLFKYISGFENYEKNLFVQKISLTFEKNMGISVFQRSEGNKLNAGCFRLYKEYEKSKKLPDSKKRKALEYIWQSWENRYNKERTESFSDRTSVYQLLFGRRIEAVPADGENGSDTANSAQPLDAKEKKDKYYQPCFSRKRLIQFCLACGQEDNIDRVLRLGGFLECGIGKAVERRVYAKKSGYSEEIAMDEREAVGQLVQYAIQYRDKLLEQWEEDTVKRSELRKDFPMIQLFQDINRDIQFVVEYFCGCYEYLRGEDPYKIQKKDRDKLLYKLCKRNEMKLAVIRDEDLFVTLGIQKLYKLERDATLYIYPVI